MDLYTIYCSGRFSPLVCIRKMIFIYFPLIIFFSFYNSWFQSLTMFSIGAACAIYNISLEVKLKHKWGLVLLGTASLLLMLYCSMIFIPGTKELYLVAILFLFVWFLYDYLYRKVWRFDFIKRCIQYTYSIFRLLVSLRKLCYWSAEEKSGAVG